MSDEHVIKNRIELAPLTTEDGERVVANDLDVKGIEIELIARHLEHIAVDFDADDFRPWGERTEYTCSASGRKPKNQEPAPLLRRQSERRSRNRIPDRAGGDLAWPV